MNNRMLGIIGGLALLVALLSPIVLGRTEKVSALFEEAEARYENKDYTEAIAKYEASLKESKKFRANPEEVQEDFATVVSFKMAMCRVKLSETSGNFEELELVIRDLEQLVENHPNNACTAKARKMIDQFYPPNPQPPAPVWVSDLSKFEAFSREKYWSLVVANRLRAQGQYTDAAEHYENFIDTDTLAFSLVAAYSLYWTGQCYYEAASKDETLLDKAIDAFQKCLEVYEGTPYTAMAKHQVSEIIEACVREGYEDLRRGQLDEAEHKAAEALRIKPQHSSAQELLKEIWETYVAQSEVYIKDEKYAQAIPLLKAAINIDKSIEGAYCKLGLAYLYLGRFQEAKAAAKIELIIDPRSEEALWILENVE